MGIFSDGDINEVEAVINKELDKRRRLKFLEGFEEGRISGKEMNSADGSRGRGGIGIFRTPPNDGIDKMIHDNYINLNSPPLNFYSFGIAFGYIINIMKYHPKHILHPYNADQFIGYARDIREYKSLFFPLLEKRLLRWDENIKKSVGELSSPEIKNYKKIVKNV